MQGRHLPQANKHLKTRRDSRRKENVQYVRMHNREGAAYS